MLNTTYVAWIALNRAATAHVEAGRYLDAAACFDALAIMDEADGMPNGATIMRNCAATWRSASIRRAA